MGCVNSSKKIKINPSNCSSTSPDPSVQDHFNATLCRSKIRELIESSNKLCFSNIDVKNLITKLDDKVENFYKIIKNIGKGSYGKVFLVKHIQSGTIRAMKIIEKESVKKQDGEQNFLKELDILTKTEHPNIIKIFEYYVDNTNFYLITEYISGGTLFDAVLKVQHLTEQKVAFIINQILKALNYLHLKGIIHRDIKPENILVHSNNNGLLGIKLIDFGLSNYFTNDKKFSLRVGSPFYIAPEVLKHNYNYKCDIWSCGIVLHVLLMGNYPFYGKSREELFFNILNKKFTMTLAIWQFVSKEVKDLLKNMLEYDYEKRFNTSQCLEHPWLIKNRGYEISESVAPEYAKIVMKNLGNLQSRERLQQATIAYITYSYCNVKEVEFLKNLFSSLDKNEDGQITFHEFSDGLSKYYDKFDSTEDSLQKIYNEIDNNNDGKISYEEFIRATVNVKKILTQKNLKLAFDHFDKDKNGTLSKREIKEALNTTDSTYVDLLIQAIDTNNDGEVSFEEFKALMETII